jgi:predicted aconitase with swiveling domain
MSAKIYVRVISPGRARGEALVSRQPINFYSGINPKTGVVVERNHELEGECIKDKILVFPYGSGSTVGSYVIYALKKNAVAPLAMVNEKTDVVVAAGCIFALIPCVDGIKVSKFRSGEKIFVDADNGFIVKE